MDETFFSLFVRSGNIIVFKNHQE